MILSNYREARKLLQKKVAETYGTISKYDMKSFINFCINDEDLIAKKWKLGTELPFDIEDLVNDYIEWDGYYLCKMDH